MSTHQRTHADTTHTHWVGDTVNIAAREQVTTLVHALWRVRCTQIFIDCASRTVFAALSASILAVAAIRAGWLPLSPWMVVSALLLLALLGATALAFHRRPDDLDVAIDADLKLKLKQRLSTAWEFMGNDARSRASTAGDEDDTAGRLAAQAVKARLPPRSRAKLVFATRANAFAMMIPVAIIALILVSIVDVNPGARDVSSASDELVVSEGLRLRNYGTRMRARARQRNLPLSDRQSQAVQGLGTHMQSGALSRNEALQRLRDLDDELDRTRREALDQGQQTRVGPLSTQSVSDIAQARGVSAQELLQQLLDGRLQASEATSQMLGSDPSALSRSGISSEELRAALARFDAGDRKVIEDMMDRLARADQAAREANELGNAREQVARARESLGDTDVRRPAEMDAPTAAAMKSEDGAPSKGGRGAATGFDDDVGDDGSFMPSGRVDESQRAREQRASNRELRIDEDGPQLKADGQIRDGGVFVSEARVLPRMGEATVDDARIDARYTQQLEQVLSNEQYPLHYKEFIRRYFLNLSEGLRTRPGEQSPGQSRGQDAQ